MKPVAFGVLGVSTHYTLRLSDPMSRTPLFGRAAIASRSAARAADAARQLGFATSYGSYEALLADPKIEAVYIPLPNHMHLEWIRKSADAGKHVLCEKPLGLSADEAAEARDYCAQKGVLLMEAFMYRFHPQWQRARELVAIGEIGAIHTIHATFSYRNDDPDNIRNQLTAGGGAILDIGCYAVSSARFLMGTEPARVISLVSRHAEFGTDSLTSAILDFGSARALFTVGTATSPHQEVLALGSGGSLRVRLPFNAYPDVPLTVDVTTGVGTRAIETGPADQYQLMVESFCNAIRNGTPVPTSPDDAVANLRVLDALFASERSGGWETV